MLWLPAILILPYLFLTAGIYRNLLKIRVFKASVKPEALVSVIIPCRNEQHNLPVVLESIRNQDYPVSLMEVIIVDDNSDDETFETASAFNSGFDIRILHNNGSGKKQAIKTGIDAAAGDLIITTDADCRMGSKWIRSIAAFHETYRPDMIICPVSISSAKGFLNKFQELEFLGLQGITAGSAIQGNPVMCNGANLSYTKKAYYSNHANLRFDIGSGDDIFLLQSMKKDHSGICWLESPDAMVTAAPSQSVLSFLRQRRRWLAKAGAYTDRFTILLGTATLLAVLPELFYLVAGLFNQVFLKILIPVFLLKSIPDFMILLNTSGRYGKKNLMSCFPAARIVYPFYVLSVIICALGESGKKVISSPFRKGT